MLCGDKASEIGKLAATPSERLAHYWSVTFHVRPRLLTLSCCRGAASILTTMSTLFVQLAEGLSIEEQRLIAETLRRIYGNKGPRQLDAADRTPSAACEGLHTASSRLVNATTTTEAAAR